MSSDRLHLSEDEIVLAANGELPRRRSEAARQHLSACGSCRSRLNEIEESFAAFVEARRSELDARLPPMQDSRAGFQSRLANAAAEPHSLWAWPGDGSWRPRLALASVALLAALGIFALTQRSEPHNSSPRIVSDVRFAPDPLLTPGRTTAVSSSELCASNSREVVASVRRPVALEVFRSHGITDPSPRAYELDHLIPPELGGVTELRNLWPQPYQGSIWNAYAKDALEDHLLRLVCGGEIDLATAQAVLARDWIAAYKKYFRTDEPLVIHASFLKDQPWE